jgi:UDP-N-acetyl-L-fucosamine synthase
MKFLILLIQIQFPVRFDVKKMRVMTIVGTRPEIIRLSRTLVKLDNHFEHILVHTGQNYDYELNEIFFKDLELRKPDYFLNASGKNSAETIGKVIIEVDKVFNEVNPEALLILGDTNSCLAVIPAKKRKIPIFHMEAGNRCFDQRVPEEINRRIIDHTADINLTYSSIAREFLLSEGLSPDMIVKTGSPMYEVLNYYMDDIKNSSILEKLNLVKDEYFVVSAHREENIESDVNFNKLINVLNSLAEKYDKPIIVSTHPRTQNRIDSTKINFHKKVKLLKPVGFKDYNKLQISSKAVLSDSGTISEESSILNFPALNIRETHERPEAMEEASVMMVGLEVDRVHQALIILDSRLPNLKTSMRLVQDYSMPNVSDKIVRIILSYTDYVKREVWGQL